MLLAFDTSTEACTAALFDGDGRLVDSRDERIGRGHAERLVPLLEDLLAGRRPDRIVVGVGPGSFTGIRVGIAAGHGLAIGWNCPVQGVSSLALLAASLPGDGPRAAAIRGGHGELFAQEFAGAPLAAAAPLRNASAEALADEIASAAVIGSGAAALVEARGRGTASDGWPSAAMIPGLADDLTQLLPKPLYARAPDARVREAA
jgi:tRNA threonylcarbamoyladenosine biosynthesis protein TsaB